MGACSDLDTSLCRSRHLGAHTDIPVVQFIHRGQDRSWFCSFLSNAGVVQCISQEIFHFGSGTQ